MYLCVLPVQEPYGDSDLTVASSEYDILSCSEILVPDLCHISEFLVPGFGRFFVAWTDASSRAGHLCERWIWSIA